MRVVFIIFLALAAANSGEWSVLKSDELELRYHPVMERAARNIFQNAKNTRSRIQTFLGFSLDMPVLAILAPDKKTFNTLQGDQVPEWASGTAYPDKGIIFLRPLDAREVRGNDLNTIFTHELAHIMLYHRLNGNRAPRWLDEGIAMQLAGQLLFTRANQLLSVGVSGRHIPFRMLNHSFPASGNYAQVAYAQSSDMVSFIQNEYGVEAFHELLDSLAKGTSLDDALEESLGMNLGLLEEYWLRSVRRRWGIAPILFGSVSLWFMISLLFLAAYIRKRRETMARLRAWELEEEPEEVSTGFDHEKYLH